MFVKLTCINGTPVNKVGPKEFGLDRIHCHLYAIFVNLMHLMVSSDSKLWVVAASSSKISYEGEMFLVVVESCMEQ
jgi:hypothetical protein